jgi:hypothetical protein
MHDLPSDEPEEVSQESGPAESFRVLRPGRTYHVEVNGMPAEEFYAERACVFSIPQLGNTVVEVFEGKLTGDPSLLRDLQPARWRGPGGISGEGFEDLLAEEVNGSFQVSLAGSGFTVVLSEPRS